MGKFVDMPWATVAGIAAAIQVLLYLLGILICVQVRRVKSALNQQGNGDSTEHGLTQFSYKQLSKSTEQFSDENKLGQGSFGSVYLGKHPISGEPIAVKKVSKDSKQGAKEFTAELSIISQLRHRNVVRLLGWCKRKADYLLVYEYIPKGCLSQFLHDSSLSRSVDPVESEPNQDKIVLSWSQRMKIVSDIAAALCYLHHGGRQRVIHRDVKSSNIMLDGNFNAILGDFGLARMVDYKKNLTTTGVAGTFGYMAAEILSKKKFTDKTDIYAFGVLILEIISGKKVFEVDLDKSVHVLLDWVWSTLRDNDFQSVADIRLQGNFVPQEMERVLALGLNCCHPNPHERPTSKTVVDILAETAPVPRVPATRPLFQVEPGNDPGAKKLSAVWSSVDLFPTTS